MAVSSFALTPTAGAAAEPAATSSHAADGGQNAEDDSPDCPEHVPPERRGNAKKLTLLGVQCFKSGDYARAYTYYSRAFGESESDLLVAAMGRSLHELGLFHLSRDYYRQFLERKEKGEGTAKIEKRLDQLEEDVASSGRRVEIGSYPSGVPVETELENGEWVRIAETPATVELREGRYRLSFDLPKYRRQIRELEVESGDSPQTVDVALVHERSAFDATGRRLKRWGLISGLGSLPLLGTGAVFFGLMNAKFSAASDYEPGVDGAPAGKNQLMAQGYNFQRWGIGFLTAGGVSAAAGAVLFLRGRALESAAPNDDGPGNDASGNDGSGESGTASARGAERTVALEPILGLGVVGLRGRF